MNDNQIYSHFENKWIDVESTETWLHRREFAKTIKGILIGVAVSLGIFVCSLLVMAALIGG